MSYTMSERTQYTIPPLTVGIANEEEWAAKRTALLDIWLEAMGKPSVDLEITDTKFDIMDEVIETDHTRLKISFQANDGDSISAYLLLPNGYKEGGRFPAVAALHPTAEEGKDAVATASGRHNRMYGLELVSRGYVVIAPDTITAGERVESDYEPFRTAPFYERHPEWTAVGKMVSDHKRTLDILCGLDGVDRSRIGAIGHSLGGYNAWFLAGLDRRVKAVVSSCGFSMFTDDPDPNRWGKRDWFTHLPSITDALANDSIPFEWHEIAALVAPTPFFIWSGLNDAIFPNWAAIAAGSKEIEKVYGVMNQSSSFECWLGNAGHDFPVQVRASAYEFLDRMLKSK